MANVDYPLMLALTYGIEGCLKRSIENLKVAEDALQKILEGSEVTGRWLDSTGSQCDEDDEGAEWHPYDEEEQDNWIASVADMAREALAQIGGLDAR